MNLLLELNLAHSGLNNLFTTNGSAEKIGLGDLLIALAIGVAGEVTSFNGRSGIVVPQFGDYTTSLVPEGTNLYFTQARVLSTTLTGYVSNPGTITPSDTILSAIEKLNGNIAYDTAESLHIDGTNSPTADIDWGGYELNNVALNANTLSIDSLSGVLYATAGVVAGSATTSNLPEGTNLYWTQARFDAAFGTKTTDNLTQGVTNLYFTTANFDAAFATKTTDNLTEGVSNLYFTNARAQAAISVTTPLTYSGGVIGIQVANSTQSGYLSSSDWNTFNTSVSEPLSIHINGDNSPTADINWGDNQITGLSGLLFNTDGAGDIGTPSNYRPLNIYASNSINAPYFTVTTSLTIDSLSGILKAVAGVVAGSATTTDLPEGTNLYFTNARVLGTQLTGFVSSPGTVTSSDTILSAIEKLTGNQSSETPGGNSGSVQYNDGFGGFAGGNFWTDGNNVAINNTYGLRFNGSGDANWQIGRNLTTLTSPYLSPQISTNTLQFVCGNGSGEGFVFGNNGGTHYFELDSNSNAWFANNVFIKQALRVGPSALNYQGTVPGFGSFGQNANVVATIGSNDTWLNGNPAAHIGFRYSDGSYMGFNMGSTDGTDIIAYFAAPSVYYTEVFKFSNNGSITMLQPTNANFLWDTDGSGNIGSSGTNRPNNAYIANGIYAANLNLLGSTSGTFTQNAASSTSSYTIFWPPSQGAPNTVLKNDGSGNLSWSTSDSIINSLTTTANTPVAIYNVTLPNNSVYYLEGRVLANYADGSSVEVFHKNVAVTATVSSSPSIVGPGETTIFESNGTVLNVDWVINGSSVELQVTGDSSLSVNWKCFVNVYAQNN